MAPLSMLPPPATRVDAGLALDMTARLRAFLTIVQPVVAVFGIVNLAAAASFGSASSLAAAIELFAFAGIATAARRALDRGKLEQAVRLLWIGILLGAAIGGFVLPEFPATLTLIALLAVALGLPYLPGRERATLLTAAGLTALEITILAEIRHVPTALPDWYVSALHVASAAVVIGLVLYLFGQTNRRLIQALQASAAVNAELRAARAELQAEHGRLHVTLRSIADGVIATDAAGNVRLINEAAERILRRSQDDVGGRPFGEVFDLRAEPDHGPLADRVLDVTDPGSPPTLPAATRLVTPAGDRLIEVAAAPIDDASGTGGVVVVFRDVTDARRAEAERRSIELRMQETQKLESLGVLAGGIAHDFNNLLVAILGNASLALADLPPASPIREHLEQIELASQRAADLARQMLAYSGRGRFVIEALDVNAVVREISQLLSVSVPKSTTMAYALDPGLPPIEGDPTQLRQVVLNLVVNAGEAIGSAGGTIRVRTALVDADARYLEGALMADELEPGRYVTLEISDTGCGMDADTRRRIFEPFFTTKFTGRGLGLAAVLGIIRGHRGAIRVYSEPGRGSSFKILLPAATATAGEARHKPPTTGWLTSGTVLIVDDEAAVRSLTARMLEPVGLDSVTASNGIEGVDRFRAEPDRFSLVLLDLTMPRLGGVEAFEAIRAIRPDIPVILMSGYAEEDASARFVGRGLRGFLQKPYSVEELISTVRGVLEAVPTAG